MSNIMKCPKCEREIEGFIEIEYDTSEYWGNVMVTRTNVLVCEFCNYELDADASYWEERDEINTES